MPKTVSIQVSGPDADGIAAELVAYLIESGRTVIDWWIENE